MKTFALSTMTVLTLCYIPAYSGLEMGSADWAEGVTSRIANVLPVTGECATWVRATAAYRANTDQRGDWDNRAAGVSHIGGVVGMEGVAILRFGWAFVRMIGPPLMGVRLAGVRHRGPDNSATTGRASPGGLVSRLGMALGTGAGSGSGRVADRPDSGINVSCHLSPPFSTLD